jgi:PAS domain S-box-containing protein
MIAALGLSYLHFLCFIVNLVMIVVVLAKAPRSGVNRICAAMFACFAVWSGALVVVHNPFAGRRLAEIFLDVSSVGGIPFCSVFLWFVYRFCGIPKRVRPSILFLLLAAPPALFLFTQLHGHAIFVIPDMQRQAWGWGTAFRSNLPWPYLNFVYSYGFVIGGIVLLVRHSLTSPDSVARQQTRIISACTIAGTIAGLAFTVVPVLLHRPFPFIVDASFMAWVAGIVHAMTRYRLFDFSPSYAAENIIGTMSDALLIVSNDGKIRTVNTSALHLFGRSEPEVVGHAAGEFFSNPEHAFGRTGGSAPPENAEIECVGAGGVRKQVLFSGSVLRDDSGAAQGMVCVFRDISGHKRAQKEKTELEERLLRSQKLEAVGRIASGIAHDFNNLHSAISGYADMILQNFGHVDTRLDKYAGAILSAARRAGGLTGKLLTFAPRGRHEMSVVDINDVVGEAAVILKRSLGNRVSVEKDLREGVATVLGDGAMLRTAVLNVALAAGEAMSDGGVLSLSTAIVRFGGPVQDAGRAAEGLDPYVVVAIHDTGAGQDQETKSVTMESLLAYAKEPDAGLGLASAYGIVKSHGGEMGLESEKGKGSTMRIYLPLISAEFRKNGSLNSSDL